jgi:hypothetical protein
VSLTTSGNAVAGWDFEPLPSTVTIPAGAATADLEVNPINDPDVEATPNAVTVTIAPAAGYTVGNPASATITITNDDTLANTCPLLYLLEPTGPNAITVQWMDNFEIETKYRVQYRLEGQSAWTTIDNLPPNTTSHTVTGLTAGVPYEFRVAAFQNTTSSLIQSQARVVVGAAADPPPAVTTFEEWRGAQGLDGALRQSAGRTTDDPDSDGTVNLLEYALGGDPLAADAPGLSVTAPDAATLELTWPENPDLTDVTTTLRETTSLGAAWTPSPLATSAGPGVRSATDTRGGTNRFYRLQVEPKAVADPSPVITCWGDSLTGNPGTYATKLPTLLPGRTVQNCGIGGDICYQIGDRMRGLTITAPNPSFSGSTAAGTPVRVVASRTTHSRIMSGSASTWPGYVATLANANRVEFFNLGRKIGESSTPLSVTVTSNRAINATRLLAPGHPFAEGMVVHFPSGPLPAPLVVGKPYYVKAPDAGGFSLTALDTLFSLTASTAAPSGRFVSAGHPFSDGAAVWFRRGAAPPGFFGEKVYVVRDADSGGFSLAEAPGGPVVTTVYNSTGNILGPPGAAVSLNADFAAATTLHGPFVLDWIHPGGPTVLSLRTHTDRDANTFIIWMGRNNSARPHETYAELAAALKHIKSLNARFLIVSVTNGGGESLGSPYYYNVVNLNALLRKQFPREFVDVRTKLIRSASTDTGDQTDRAADIPPRSLRGDNVHFNDAGQQIIAETLAQRLTELGW